MFLTFQLYKQLGHLNRVAQVGSPPLDEEYAIKTTNQSVPSKLSHLTVQFSIPSNSCGLHFSTTALIRHPGLLLKHHRPVSLWPIQQSCPDTLSKFTPRPTTARSAKLLNVLHPFIILLIRLQWSPRLWLWYPTTCTIQ